MTGPGLSRFDFYPRDWIAGTRTLTAAAKGVYIDLLAAMYDRGQAIDADPKWLCRLLGFRDRRQLQPILDELLADRKIEIRDGRIHNRRADAEIEKAHRDIRNGSKGGRPKKQAAPEGDQKAPSAAPAGDQRPSSTLFPVDHFQGKQALSQNPPSPSPSPSPKKRESRSRQRALDVDTLPTAWRDFCQRERPDLDPTHTFATFKDVAADKAWLSADWLAKWRTFVRREHRPAVGNRRAGPSSGALQDIVLRRGGRSQSL
ncbi:MAG: DUF1376 domain-containing protein [Sneathiellaceae bacterium]